MDTFKGPEISVYARPDRSLECFKCQRTITAINIALLVRTLPHEAFQPWCPRCTLWLVAHATRAAAEDGVVFTL